MDIGGVISIDEFVQMTTAHGFNRIYGNPSIPMRCMWLICLLAATGAFGYNLTLLITNYMSTPVSATISPGAIQFQDPDITVCNVAPVSSTTYYETVTKTREVYNQMLMQANQVASTVVSKGLTPSLDILLQVSRDVFDPKLLLRYLAHRPEYFITRCMYKGVKCSYADFSNFWNSRFGNCFRFKPTDPVVQATKDIVEFSLDLVLFTDTAPVVTTTESNTIYGVLTAGMTFEGKYDDSKSGGAILFYGDRDRYPRDYINLSPGVQSYVNFQMVEHRYVNRDSKRCNQDNGFVYYEDSVGNRVQFLSNRVDCQFRKQLDKILSDCDCLTSRIAPPYSSVTERLNTSAKCQYLAMDTNTTAFVQRRTCEKLLIEKQSTYFNQIVDECQISCTERIYTPIISMTSWPLNSLAVRCKDSIMTQAIANLQANNVTVPDTFYHFLRNLNTTADVQRNFSSNFAQVSLGAYTAFSELIEENQSFKIFDLFSSIGGILGLYLGMSLLTVCELFELVFVLISELQIAVKGHKERKEWKQQHKKRRQAVIRALSRVMNGEQTEGNLERSSTDRSLFTDRTLDSIFLVETHRPPATAVEPQTSQARLSSVSRLRIELDASRPNVTASLQSQQPQKVAHEQQVKPKVTRVMPMIPGQLD